METREQLLKRQYGFNKNSYKFVPAGSEILKYIGQIVVLVNLKKVGDNMWDQDTIEKAQIISITDFDPMTMTYLCKYKVADDKIEDEPREIRIIPEGFSWGNSEETGDMKRFIPYSLHCTMVETELFWCHLWDIWKARDTISVDSLLTLSGSKEKESTLKYSHNIGALINLESGELLWTRITELNFRHKVGNQYNLKFGNGTDSWTMMITSGDKEYDFENGLGKLKLVDLAD